MTQNIKDSPLYPIVNPKSIAFFGASNRFSSMGSNQLNSLMSLGFEGQVYPIHPKEEQVQGLAAYQSVLDLPEIPDVAVMVLPTGVVPRVLEECGRKGIRRAVVVSGGFKEVGPDGTLLEKKIVDIDSQLDLCFASDKDDLARGLIKKKLEAERLLKRLGSSHEANKKFLEEQRVLLDENNATLESLRQKAELFAHRAPVHSDSGSEFDDIAWMAREMTVGDDEVEIAYLREKSLRSAS